LTHGQAGGNDLRKRYYIIFVARAEDGQLKKIPIPLHYAYGFVAAAVVGAFTLTGMAGSYSRMLLKTAHFNEVRSQREAFRKDYVQMEQVAHEKDIQAASLGSLASEVSALYGLKQNKIAAAAIASAPSASAGAEGPSAKAAGQSAAASDEDPVYRESREELSSLLSSAMSGRLSQALESGPGTGLYTSSRDLLSLADAPSLWPVVGRITSSFGEREDPFNGEGAFHSGVDIACSFGEPVHVAADGVVESAAMGNGYGREIVVDHGHGIHTIYAHLSGFAITAGQHVTRGQTIGFVGQSGRSTGPHLHYEVRVENTPVNPHKYMRTTMQELAGNSGAAVAIGGGY
jgi:murein DD-endopeptidase MepM/ murein hydrolase activator NlpD